MKVSVYKEDGGALSVLLEASPGKGLAPVLVRGVTLDNITDKVSVEVEKMRAYVKPAPVYGL